MTISPWRFGVMTLLWILVAHAVDFFTHEYAHALMAWLLGWKSNPFALHYGSATLDNILLQQQIDENVDYAPIFATHHGLDAALIAFAGPGLANGGMALLTHAVLRRAGGRLTPFPARALIWLDAFATFNVWSYAPLRSLSTHGDMALLARGLGLSAWLVFPFTAAAATWLLWRLVFTALPIAERAIHPDHPPSRAILGTSVIATSLAFFGTGPIWGTYGTASALLAMGSTFVLLPALLGTRLTDMFQANSSWANPPAASEAPVSADATECHPQPLSVAAQHGLIPALPQPQAQKRTHAPAQHGH